MATIRDGLGFEELGDASDATAKAALINVTGSITAGQAISGLNVFAQGSGTFGRLTDANGALFPVNAGSPGAFGYSIQAGSAVTNSAGIGSVWFRRNFVNTQYFISLMPGSTAAAEGVQGVIGSMQPVISGLKITSGLIFFGGPTQPYDYIAVGLI